MGYCSSGIGCSSDIHYNNVAAIDDARASNIPIFMQTSGRCGASENMIQAWFFFDVILEDVRADWEKPTTIPTIHLHSPTNTQNQSKISRGRTVHPPIRNLHTSLRIVLEYS